MQPSMQQQAVLRRLAETSDNIEVNATAGAGKTTLLRLICETLPRSASAVYLAFNKSIAKEAEAKLPPHIVCTTFHSHAFASCRRAVRGVKVDQRKLESVLDVALSRHSLDLQAIARPDLRKLVPIAMNCLLDGLDHGALWAASNQCGNGLEAPQESLPLVADVLQRMYAQRGYVNFDEMLVHPIVLQYGFSKFDYVLVDEAQDLNPAQHEVVAQSLAPGGRLVVVGDRRQAIYGFRGADPASMDRLRERFGCTPLPLSVSFRCPRAVVELAQGVVGNEVIQAADTAIDGEVVDRDHTQLDTTLDELRNGDMVLCRVNAPLMPNALRLIRQGRKALVRGRDIGVELANLVRRQKAQTVVELCERLAKWRSDHVQLAVASGREAQTIAINDKFDTIMAVIDGSEEQDVAGIILAIQNIFSDDVQGTIFSSIHRAKGLEAANVVILGPELLPHPRAVGEAQQVQEANLEYVAYTRSQARLVLQALPPKR